MFQLETDDADRWWNSEAPAFVRPVSASTGFSLFRTFMRTILLAGAAALALAGPLDAQARPAATRQGAPAARPVSAPISNIRYEVTFDSATARTRELGLAMTFDVAAGAGPVLLSLPVWTPGAYEVTDFAKNVSDFTAVAGASVAAAAGERALDWDKTDPDTWRIDPAGARSVTVRYDFVADSLDNAMAWARPDFVFFNGTNVFMHAEGRGYDFPATVRVRTAGGWNVATGMRPVTGQARTYREGSYHDLVDMPFFVGRFDVDSQRIEGKWQRLATYPAGSFQGAPRAQLWDQLRRMTPAMVKVTGEQPWTDYTTMMVFQPETGSALEHQNSHLGIYDPQFMGTPILASITAHEIFHAWNVKRLRPADLVPYDYAGKQPTPLLWVSEGITDYYADLALVRGGIIDSSAFLGLTTGKIAQVSDARPVALEDASLSTWIHPKDGTAYLYYPKGSLAGLMLDVLIRDGSDNRHGLDDVLRELWRTAYQQGRGFTTEQFYAVASRLAGGRSFAEFHDKYVDGRDPYPWATVLPLAGLRLRADSTRAPRVGLGTAPDSAGAGVLVTAVAPGSPAEAAGVQAGDVVTSVGGLATSDPTWPVRFRQQFGREGAAFPIVVRRDGRERTLNATMRLAVTVTHAVEFAPGASAKALRVRSGILKGETTGATAPAR